MTHGQHSDEHEAPHGVPRRSLFRRRDESGLGGVVGAAKAFASIVVALGLIIAGAAAFGFGSTTPSRTLEAMGRRLDGHDAQISRLEHRVDTLSARQGFTNYLLCVQMRMTNPAMLPPDCAPIIEGRGR